MKKERTIILLFTILALVFGNGICFAQTKRTIHVTTAGTLPEFISENEKYQIEELTLTGELNGTDFRLIRDMAGCNYLGNITGGILHTLDLSDTKIVEGGEKYLDTEEIALSTGDGIGGGFRFYTTANTIGECLFAGCSSLTNLKLPNGITSIAIEGLAYCRNVTTIVIPNSVTYIGQGGVLGCRSLKSITIPSSVTSIGKRAFLECPAMEEVIIEEGNNNYVSVDGVLFSKDMTTMIHYPCGKFLTEYYIPASVTRIEEFVFYYCKLLSRISIPDGVTYIGYSAFCGCEGLTSISLPNSLTQISKSAFMSCNGLTSITIPNSVTTIGERAFYSCDNLTTLTIGNRVTSIGELAFGYCEKLISIVSEIKNPFVIPDNVFDGKSYIYSTATLTVPQGTKTSYQATSGWNKFTNILEAGGSSSSEEVRNFSSGGISYIINDNRTTVTVTAGSTKYEGSISIPSSVYYNGKTYDVTSIGYGAFSDCTGLSSISIPNSVGYIQNKAFYGCSRLSSITLPNSIVFIGQYAFIGCSNLTKIVSEIASPFSLEGSTFENSTFNNATLTVPAGTKSLYQSTGGWMNFKNIIEAGSNPSNTSTKRNIYVATAGTLINYISDEEKYKIEELTLSGELNGTDIHLIRDMAGINNDKMYRDGSIPFGCETNGKLRFLDISEAKIVEGGRDYYRLLISDEPYDVWDRFEYTTNNKISSYMFAFCYALEEIILPYSVTSIGDHVFYACSNLTSITLPKSIASIGQYSFIACSSLTNIISKIESPYPLEESTFDNSTFNNATLTVPAGTKSLYLSTGGWMNFMNIVEAGSGEVQTKRTIHVATAGTLSRYISENEKYKIEELTLTGEINGTDFRLLRDMAGRSNWDFGSSDGKLAVLNLSGVKIVAGGEYIWGYDQSGSSSSYYLLNNNEIPSSVFMGCKGLVSVTLPDNVVSIANSAFFGCGMTSITIPNSVKYIGGSAFDGTPWYDNQPDGLIYLGKFAYKYKGEMPANTSITINDGTIGIVGRAFDHCEGLSSITMPNSIIYIGDYAFYYCSGLKSITIPSSVTSIEVGAFNGCSGLTSISSEIKNPFAIYCFDNSTYSAVELTVPDGTRSAYQSTEGWKNFSKIYEYSENQEVEFVISGITYQGTKLTKMVYVKAVETNQTSVEVPASVTYDGATYKVNGALDHAFDGCTMAALIWGPGFALPSSAFTNASIGSNFLLYVSLVSYAPSSVKNVVVNGTAQTIVLSDDGGPFYCPKSFKANNISYTHNYGMETGGNGKGWETIALPFDVQTIKHSSKGEMVPFGQYNPNSDKKPFWLGRFSFDSFAININIQAYTPYIIAMPNQSSYKSDYILKGDVTFSADNVTIKETPTFSGKFMPAFTTVPKSSNVFAINAVNRYVSQTGGYDAGSRFISNLRDVRPFEAYITESSTRGVIDINYGDNTTDIEELLGFANSDKEVSVYTLNGQKVMQTKQSELENAMNQLPRGVYIVNGKKIVK